jgi:FlaA1/EpsC-like NDP-sugar epimerase
VNALKRYLQYLFRFSPRSRTAMLLMLDLGLCTFAALLAYSLRVGEWRVFTIHALKLIILTNGLWLLIAPVQGVYRSFLRFSGADTIKDLATSCGLVALVMSVLLIGFHVADTLPRTIAVLAPVMMFITLATARMALSSLLRAARYSRALSCRRKVLDYGSAVAGLELVL